MVLGELPVPGRPTITSRVNFQCRSVLLIWIIVGQGLIALAVGGGCLDIFFSRLSFFFLPVWVTARYRLNYCLKELFNTKQPTNRPRYGTFYPQ